MNILSILVAAAGAFITGFLMHGPAFGKTWMRLANVTPTGNEKFSGMWKQMLYNYIAFAVMAGVLSGMFAIIFTSPVMGSATWFRGAISAAWIWFGFILTGSSMEVIWMKRSWKLWLFDAVSMLLSMMVMGAILAGW